MIQSVCPLMDGHRSHAEKLSMPSNPVTPLSLYSTECCQSLAVCQTAHPRLKRACSTTMDPLIAAQVLCIVRKWMGWCASE